MFHSSSMAPPSSTELCTTVSSSVPGEPQQPRPHHQKKRRYIRIFFSYSRSEILWLTVNMKTREIHHSLALPRMVTRVLKELSQPKSEVSPPDGLLAVSLLRHQRIALSWMVQKKTSSLYCCSGIKIPISRSPSKGYRKLQAVLKIIMLRRTKGSLLDGEPIISLPPKSVELKKVEFSQQERDFYSRLEADSCAQFQFVGGKGRMVSCLRSFGHANIDCLIGRKKDKL